MTGRNIAPDRPSRGGTTLSCHLLDACADTVALFEPMDVTALDETPAEALNQVDAFFAQSRHSLLTAGTAPSKHRGGTVPDNPFGERDPDGRRRLQVDHGQIAPGRPAEGFTLVVKHNAAFCALLPDLATRFDTLAIVRNPLAVLASWNTVDLPVSQGRIPAGERLDPRLRQRLDAEPDRLARQLIVLGWFFEHFQQQLDPSRVLRYEEIVASGGDALRTAAGLQGARRHDLTVRNDSALYRDLQIAPLADALHRYKDAPWRMWYDHVAIAALAADLGVAAT